MANKNDDAITKSANQVTSYTEEELKQLLQCIEDPAYFMKTFMKVQHPLKGSIPFIPYEYQLRMIESFQNNLKTVALCGRQLGKSSTYSTRIIKDGIPVQIGEIISLTLKEKVINFLETLLIKIS